MCDLILTKLYSLKTIGRHTADIALIVAELFTESSSNITLQELYEVSGSGATADARFSQVRL
jgi:hypothetical protein